MPCIDKQNILAHASAYDEKIMLAKLYDSYCLSVKTGKKFFSGFLAPADIVLAKSAFPDECGMTFFGGADDAERQMVGFNSEKEDYPISVIISEGKTEGLTHRDFLGSIMSLGITRETVGDIYISDGKAYIFHLSSMTEYILNNLTEVKKTAVKNSVTQVENVFVERKYEITRKSVASPRADAVVGAAFNMSRSDASAAIERDEVTLNYRKLLSKDKRINTGDVISMRGKGKAVVELSGDVSKKGRLFIDVKKYV